MVNLQVQKCTLIRPQKIESYRQIFFQNWTYRQNSGFSELLINFPVPTRELTSLFYAWNIKILLFCISFSASLVKTSVVMKAVVWKIWPSTDADSPPLSFFSGFFDIGTGQIYLNKTFELKIKTLLRGQLSIMH